MRGAAWRGALGRIRRVLLGVAGAWLVTSQSACGAATYSQRIGCTLDGSDATKVRWDCTDFEQVSDVVALAKASDFVIDVERLVSDLTPWVPPDLDASPRQSGMVVGAVAARALGLADGVEAFCASNLALGAYLEGDSCVIDVATRALLKEPVSCESPEFGRGRVTLRLTPHAAGPEPVFRYDMLIGGIEQCRWHSAGHLLNAFLDKALRAAAPQAAQICATELKRLAWLRLANSTSPVAELQCVPEPR